MIMKSLIMSFVLVTFGVISSVQAREKFWTERDANAPALVNLPHLGPIIDQVDATIVNIATSAEPKAEPRRRMEQMDPFSNPDEFFQRFFGNPFREMQRQPRRSLGSGFLISKDGYIVTNNHVIEGADKIEVTILSSDKNNGRQGDKFEAKIVGRDPATDLALIKIDPTRDLPFVPLGNSSTIRKGDWSLAFGNPFGLDHSVSLGIISAIGREISPNENRRFDDFIQTDAAINFGNSGGPLVNLKGEVIGVNTAITAQGSGIGFAVPVNILKDILPSLKESGTVARGYLGVMIQDVTEEMKDALGLPSAKGVLINDIVPDGPAARSQLKRGDVIVKIGSTEITDARTLQQTVAKVRPGQSVNVHIVREKRTMQVSVKVGNLQDDSQVPAADAEPSKTDKLGLAVGATPDNSAVVIQDVAVNSPAAQANIIPGDLIKKLNGQDVTTVESYQRIVSGLKSKQTVLMDLERRNTKLFIAFRVP
jgi:serine protease Do